MRSGTENVPGVAGMGVAAKEMYTHHEEKVDYLYELKDYFVQEKGNLDSHHLLRGIDVWASVLTHDELSHLRIGLADVYRIL